MAEILSGFSDALGIDSLLWVTLGILFGYVVGVIPGLNRATALAVAVPLTFYLSPLAAIAFLVGISKASAAGGAVTAILLNVPGEPSSAATTLDGYPLTRQGKSRKALELALYASVIGDLLATILLICVAAPIAQVALRFGPIELAAVLAFSLTSIAALSGESRLKGLIAGLAGIALATVGLDPETATPRFTFGRIELMDGIPILAIAIGTLALAEMLVQIEAHVTRGDRGSVTPPPSVRGQPGLTWPEFRASLRTIARGSTIGAGVGILPGLGATVASFFSYAAARRASADPESFGKGQLEGVAASESADNAVVPASFIPLFALGIPGNLAAAILIGAFMIHGLTPGPLMLEQNARLVYGIYGSMLLASLVMLVVGKLGVPLLARVAVVPPGVVIPVVVLLCICGAYLEGQGIFAVYLMLGFGVLGYLMRKLDFSFVSFVIGFIIGPMFELALRQSVIISRGEWRVLLDHPIALVFLGLTVLAVWRLGGGRIGGGPQAAT